MLKQSEVSKKSAWLRAVAPVLLTALLSFVLGGCLLVDSKEYRFKINPDGSGSGTITFVNIQSVQEDSTERAAKDYTQLVLDYFKGKKFEDSHPALMNVKKRLYEEKGHLNGEITFSFLTYQDVGLYRYQDKGPWMYYAGTSTGMNVEMIDSTNGTYTGDKMPMVFWPDSTSNFRLVTSFEKPSRSAVPLLALYKRIGTD